MKLSDLSKEQTEALARKMGYQGPMHKFEEFIASKPKKMATGGMVSKNPESAVATSEDIPQGSLRYQKVSSGLEAANVPNVQVTRQKVFNGQLIDQNAGDLQREVKVDPTTTIDPATAAQPDKVEASKVDAALTQDSVEDVVKGFQSAQGQVAEESTVQGQLSNLMSQFENGEVPPWAAGAIRQANAVMAQRGLSSSSMAGQAVLQAAMESAMPIAQQDAQTNFQMQIQNLSNEQQKLMMANEARVQSLFTDAAAENASRQFNASSENQTKQFMASLKSQVEQFNTSQINAAKQFNAGEKNARSLFVANMENQRQQFEATNRLVIDQANAAWRQAVSTQNNANINEANRINASARLEMSLSEMNNKFQARRDKLNFAFTAGQNERDRATELTLANMSAEEAEKIRDSERDSALWNAAGKFVASWWE